MSPREAVCTYIGWDFSESLDYRYHYGRTSAPIYSTSDGYICAVATKKKPPKYDGLEWTLAKGTTAEFITNQGKDIYICTSNIEP
jgi:hypothetical protein